MGPDKQYVDTFNKYKGLLLNSLFLKYSDFNKTFTLIDDSFNI